MNQGEKKIVMGGILAEGELTGHCHRVDREVMEEESGDRIFCGSTEVKHEEHNPILLGDKNWASGGVRGWDSWEKEVQKISD